MAEELSLETALDEIDSRLKELEDKIELGAIIERLHENEDFKKLILDGYLDDEAKRLFGVLVEPSTLKRDVMENIQDKLSSIRNLKQYFGTSLQNALMAPDAIEEEKAYRKEVTEHFANKSAETTE